MSTRNAETICREINEKIVKRSELVTMAKEIIVRELKKSDTFSYAVDEKAHTVTVIGYQYGKAVLDLDYWFGQVRDSDPADSVARDMMEDIKNQLLPERDYSM